MVINKRSIFSAIGSVFLILLIASLGFDRLSVRVGEATIRFSYVLFFIAFLILFTRREIKLNFLNTILLAGFILLSVPSVFVSYNPVKSIAYIAWLIVNYLFVFTVFATLAKYYSQKLYNCIIYSFRFQIVFGWLIVLLGINLNETIFVSRITWSEFNAGRAYLFYYEPSFFAIALATYAAIVIDRVMRLQIKSSWLDFLILLIALYSTKSATLILVILILVAIRTVTPKINLKWIGISILFSILFAVSAYAYSSTQHDLIAVTVQEAIQADDPIQYLTIRSGGRVVRMICAIDTFLAHPWIGVGIGAYEAYSRNVDLTYCIKNLDYPVWGDPVTNAPAINIYIELLSTTGVFATFCFFLFLARILFRKSLRQLTQTQFQYWLGLAAILTIMATQANYLTLCIWMAMGIYFGSLQQRTSIYQVQFVNSSRSSQLHPIIS
jgi:hypothetical protein